MHKLIYKNCITLLYIITDTYNERLGQMFEVVVQFPAWRHSVHTNYVTYKVQDKIANFYKRICHICNTKSHLYLEDFVCGRLVHILRYIIQSMTYAFIPWYSVCAAHIRVYTNIMANFVSSAMQAPKFLSCFHQIWQHVCHLKDRVYYKQGHEKNLMVISP